MLVEAGDVIPGDGEVIEGVASVDESAITGESAPVIRESGGDRSAVTGGTRVLSDWLIVRISANPGEAFLDRMIAMVEGAKRQKTPNEIALNILLAGFTIIFLLATATLLPYSIYSVSVAGQGTPVTVTVLVALLVCLIPTTIGGLLSAIGIAGMDRMHQANVIAMSGRAVEAAGDVDVLLLDKTGTITLGNRQATAFLPAAGVPERDLADAAQLASLADETPEGRSIVVLAKQKYAIRERDVTGMGATFVAFTAQTRMSGVNLNGREVRKGAADAVEAYVRALGGELPAPVRATVDGVAKQGATPLVVADGPRVLGVIQLKDVVKGGIRERFGELRKMGIKTIMITGDNPLTAAAIAAEAGVDDFLAQATPEAKLKLIREYQAGGRLVAMTGDGTNDAPALAQADVAVAMNSGTQAAKEAGNMVDLDSNPTKLIEVVETGKADADDPGRADDLQHRQRRGEVLRDHPGRLCDHLPRAQRPQRHGAGHTPERDPVGGDLQRPHHHRPRPAGAARRPLPPDGGIGAAPAVRLDLRGRRHRRALRRDQADRHDPGGTWPGLTRGDPQPWTSSDQRS